MRTSALIFATASCHLATIAAQATPRPSAAVPWETPRYELAVAIRPESHHLDATGTLRLPPAKTVRDSLELVLSDVFHDFRVDFVEPAESAGAARLENRTSADGHVTYLLTPTHPVPAETPALLRFSYAGGEKVAFVFYLGPEGSFAGGPNTAWYPQVDDSRGVGTLDFTVPPGYTVFATGASRTSSDAASQGHFSFALNDPSLFSFAAARYTVAHHDGAVPFTAYLLQPRPSAASYVSGCSRVLEVLVREFGPFPYPGFSLVEVPSEQAAAARFGGAGVAGAIFTPSDGLDAPFNLAYYGHEISHQWWGNLVTHRGRRGANMQDEALAQFGALRVVQQIEGSAAAEAFRRTGYPGYADQSAREYFLLSEAGLDHNLADLPASIVGHELADSKGLLVLDLLAQTIGRDCFRGILREFASRNAFRPATWEEFLEAIQAGAQTDIGWFVRQWFEQTGAPDWRVTWKQQGGTLQVAIAQLEPYYRLSVEVELEGRAGQDGKRLSKTIEINGTRTEFTLPVRFTVNSVTVDPHYEVLHWTPEFHGEASALASFTRANMDRIEGRYEKAAAGFEQALSLVPPPDVYGARFLLEYGLARALMSQDKWHEARAHFEAALRCPTRSPSVLPWAYVQLAKVAFKLGDLTAARQAVEFSVCADASAGGRTGAAEVAHALLRRAESGQ